METLKRMAMVLWVIIFFSLLISQFIHAEIYKWVDEKGTVHFTEDPATIPEKYREKTQSRTTEEDLIPYEQRIRLKKKEEAELRERLKREQNEAEIRRLEERLKKVSESVEKERREAERKREEANRVPSPGYIPFERFKHVTKGMTEAEVLSRFGPPTSVQEDEVKSKGTITGDVSRGGALNASYKGEAHIVKKYYYIGDRSKGEQTRVIIFEKGKVVDYKSISP
jgi:predicted ribosome quality control (RQC) complex YloA/Tae2 family protein